MSAFNEATRLEALESYLSDVLGYNASLDAKRREVVLEETDDSMVYVTLAGVGFDVCNDWLPFKPSGDFPLVDWDTASRYVAKVSDIEGVLWRAFRGYHD